MKKLRKPFALLLLFSALMIGISSFQEAKAEHVTCTNCGTTGIWCPVLQQWLMRCTYNGNGCDVSAQKLCEVN